MKSRTITITVDVDEVLSPREREVMSRWVAGEKLRETAVALEIAPSTVSQYRFRLMRKLHMRSFADLVRWDALNAA